MASSTELLDIVVRLRGGAAAASEAGLVSRSIGGIVRAAGGLAAGFSAWRGIMAGINFNATMETNQIAFEQFTGSVKLASGEIEALRQLSNNIPAVGFETFASNAKRLLAFGTPLARVNTDLKTLAEASMGLGLGSEGIDRMVIALGQMRSTGVIQGDELRQLQEAGIKVYDYMIDAGIITRKDIGKIGDMHLEAASTIDAIMQGMQRDFGGLAARSSGTWAAQMGNLRNQATQAAGALVKPVQDFLQSNVLPQMAARFKEIAGYLQGGGAQDIYRTLGQILTILSPLIAAFLAYRTALLLVAAAQALVAFTSGAMGIASTLATVIMLIPAVRSLADAFYLLAAAELANPVGLIIAAIIALIAGLTYAYFKVDWFHRFVDNAWDGMTSGAVAVGHGIAAAFTWAANAVKDVINTIISGWNSLQFAIPRIHVPGLGDIGGGRVGVTPLGLLANGGALGPGGRAIVGEAGPELLEHRGGRSVVTPLGGGAPQRLQPIQLNVDGRVLAEIVLEHGMTAVARG